MVTFRIITYYCDQLLRLKSWCHPERPSYLPGNEFREGEHIAFDAGVIECAQAPFDDRLQKTALHQPVAVDAAHLSGLKDALSVLLQFAENFQGSGEFFVRSGHSLLRLCTFIATFEHKLIMTHRYKSIAT